MRNLVLSIGATLLMVACQSYDVTINEKMVYSPAKLLTDYDITDPALRACISQRIEDEFISSSIELEWLNCGDGDIESLAGLAQFSGLKELKLSGNRIRNLVELGQIKTLQRVWLDGNRIVDPVPLTGLEQLQEVDLSNNPDLQCPTQTRFASTVRLTLPKHCRSS